MKPTEYLAEFPKHTSLNQDDPCQMFNQHLDSMLRRIGIDDPNEGTTTELGRIAALVIEEDRNSTELEKNASHRLNNKGARGRIEIVKYRDCSNEMSLEEIQNVARRDAETVRLKIGYASALILAKTVDIAPKVGVEAGATQAMGNQYMRVSDAIARMAYQINVERNFYRNRQVGDTEISVSSIPKLNIPSWIGDIQGWKDGPVDILTGSHVETDAMVVMLEWCRSRKNGFIPVFAPPNIDSGQYSQSRQCSNLQSDILLCRLQPGKEEIIPVQVKTSAIDSEGAVHEYDSNVLILTAQHLGLVSAVQATMRVDGIVHTGTRTKLEAGRHTKEWTAALLVKHNRAQKHKAYLRSLGGVFDQVDKLVDQKLPNY